MLEKNHEKRFNFMEFADLCRENDENIIANHREMISLLPNKTNNNIGFMPNDIIFKRYNQYIGRHGGS